MLPRIGNYVSPIMLKTKVRHFLANSKQQFINNLWNQQQLFARFIQDNDTLFQFFITINEVNQFQCKTNFIPLYYEFIALKHNQCATSSSVLVTRTRDHDIVTSKPSIDNCVNQGARFILLALSIGDEIYPEPVRHQNALIIDTYRGTIERFEPYGAEFQYGYDIDDTIRDLFSEYEYVPPLDYSPIMSVQELQEREIITAVIHYKPQSKELSGLIGFCVAWSVWYTDLRLTYPDVDRYQLVKDAIQSLSQNPGLFTAFIVSYTEYLTKAVQYYSFS